MGVVQAEARARALCALLREPAAGVPPGIAWEALHACARRHHLEPFLYFRLRRDAPSVSVPPPVLAALRRQYHTVAARNLRLGHDLRRILRCLAGRRVPAIVLKGGHLAHAVYPRPALRPMMDIDLLVRREGLADAVAALRGLGYAPWDGPRDMAPVDSVQSHVPTMSLPSVAGSSPPIPVELHWTIVRPAARLALAPEGLWARACRTDVAGTEALVLAPEDLLHHLVLHLAADDLFRTGLLPLLDMARVVGHFADRFDWDRFLAIVAETGSGRHACLALSLATEFLDVPIPSRVMAGLHPPGMPEAVPGWARDLLLQDTDLRTAEAVAIGLVAGASGQGGNVLRKVLPPRDELADTYGVPTSSWRIWLRYPVRWRDLWRRYRRSAWRLLRGDPRDRAALAVGASGRRLAEWLAPSARE